MNTHRPPTTHERPRRWSGLALGLGLLLACALIAAPAVARDLNDMARALSRVRAEVEGLAQDIRDVEERKRQRLRSLATQETDVEIEIGRQRLRLQQLKERREKLQAEIAQRDAAVSALHPAARSALSQARAALQQTLPFKRQERLAALDEIQQRLDDNLITPQQALWRTWERVEDEERLARENSLHQQTIELDGERVLAEVAKLGMVMLYFRTPDGRVGALQGPGERARWVTEEDPERREQLLALFDALTKQIRVGFFTLPSALPQEAP